jgi:hypothetical protein
MTNPLEEILSKFAIAGLTAGAGWAAKKVKEEWKYRLPSRSFRRNIHGNWSGQVTGSFKDKPFAFPINLHLRPSWRATIGDGELTANAIAGSFKIKGGLFSREFLKLEYWSMDAGRTQFGTIVLRLTPSGNRLSGRFVGYGAFSETVVDGQITLDKRES